VGFPHQKLPERPSPESEAESASRQPAGRRRYSFAAYGQAFDLDCGGGYCAAEFQVTRDFGDIEKQFLQVPRYRDFFYGIR
jgi:hypothetical protein